MFLTIPDIIIEIHTVFLNYVYIKTLLNFYQDKVVNTNFIIKTMSDMIQIWQRLIQIKIYNVFVGFPQFFKDPADCAILSDLLGLNQGILLPHLSISYLVSSQKALLYQHSASSHFLLLSVAPTSIFVGNLLLWYSRTLVLLLYLCWPLSVNYKWL